MGRRKAAVLDGVVELDGALQAVAHSTREEMKLPEGWSWEPDRTTALPADADPQVLIEHPVDYGLTRGTSMRYRWGVVWWEKIAGKWICKAGEWQDAGLTFHSTQEAAKAAAVVATLAKKLEKFLRARQQP